MPKSDVRGVQVALKMSDRDRAREALTKSSFVLQSTNPKDDIKIKRLELQRSKCQRLITNNIKKARDTFDSITKLKSQDGVTDSCRLKAGLVASGVTYLDVAQRELVNFSECNEIFNDAMNELAIVVPDLENECNERKESAESDWNESNLALNDVIQITAKMFQSTHGASIPSSRESSPPRVQGVQRRTVNVKHLMPSPLGAECSIKEYRKFKREFTIWADSAYPDGHGSEDTWGTLNNRLDSVWQDRTREVEGIDKMGLTNVWKELDKLMMSIFPTHARRMSFLALRPEKGQAPSEFILKLKEESVDAKIDQLTEAALILHLTTAGLIPGELTNKIKPLILEELRTNPNPKANHLRDLVEKIKGIEVLE